MSANFMHLKKMHIYDFENILENKQFGFKNGVLNVKEEIGSFLREIIILTCNLANHVFSVWAPISYF